ncbi:DUF4401 domain-containing protein [Pseudomonas sp. MYb185]|uniref:DUF4401 domain-containing protein n=1 Tax=Pseudomonas sp. MYb185 TaxID=1848729 RepID=UPI000CFB42A8|nr:DUF4401 domain-containing protein [Pseudomonas sp. MYb185]PRB81920.1 hypothetical protein CQ007_06965 [Pseudomonas sp. MYb185]
MSRAWQQGLIEALQQRQILDPPAVERVRDEHAAPWYMALLSGLAAWLAALLLLGSSLITIIDDSAPASAISGGLLLALAIWLLRRPGVFAAQLGLALSLVGQGLLVFALVQLEPWAAAGQRLPALGALLVAAGMLLPPAHGAHRLVCALIAMFSLAVLIGANALLSLYGLLLAALGICLWLQRSGWAGKRAALYRAIAGAATVMALVLAILGHGRWGDLLGLLLNDRTVQLLTWLYPVGAGLLLLATVSWLVRGEKPAFRLGCAAAVVIVVALCAQAPGLLVGAALWLAVFQASDRFWCVLVGIGTTLYLGDLYYSLHITLLHKSMLLVATGLVLLLLRWLLLRQWGGRYEG